MAGSTFVPGPFGARPQWQEVLQQPYLNTYAPDPQARLAEYAATTRGAGMIELDELTKALEAQRQKQMADLIAADAKRNAGRGGGGGGRGRGGGGGGGKAAPVSLSAINPLDNGDWYDQMAATYANQSAPPTFDAHLYPSTAQGVDNVYRLPYRSSSHVTPRASQPSYMTPGHLVGTLPKPPTIRPVSRSRVVLS